MPNESGFVAHLYALSVRERDPGDTRAPAARAALAALRRGRGKEPGTVPEMYPHVVPWLPQETEDRYSDRWGEECHFLVAALFAGHRWSREHVGPDAFAETHRNLGWSFHRFERAAEADGRAVSESTEKRFAALLECGRDDLPDHLRYAVNLLDDTPIDWGQLLTDLRRWDTGANVPMQWARQYWYRSPRLPDDDTAAQTEHDGTDDTDDTETESE